MMIFSSLIKNILVDNEEVYQKYCFVLLVKIFFPKRDNIIPKDLNDLSEFLENLPLDKVLEKETVKNMIIKLSQRTGQDLKEVTKDTKSNRSNKSEDSLDKVPVRDTSKAR